ncbi:MAG: hypothetical protein IPG45_24760 [Deltaproteobacteria bacterium]|nr:hypothetical protein [Deltaproteobacteria bacterium]
MIALLAIGAGAILQVRLQTLLRHRGPVRRVAVPLLLLGLLLPTVAQASPAPLRWRSSAIVSGEGEISSGRASREGSSFGENRTSGFRLFLQVDPSGYADSPNLYAGFANDPVNHRDPTGRKISLRKVGDLEVAQLLSALRFITGLDLDVCSEAESLATACQRGHLIVRSTSDSVAPRFSSFARDVLLDAIADPSVIEVEANNGSSEAFGTDFAGGVNHPGDTSPSPRTPFNFAPGAIEIDFRDFAFQKGPQNITDPVVGAHSVGFTFFHELFHRAVVKSEADLSVMGGVRYFTLGDPDPGDPEPGETEEL